MNSGFWAWKSFKLVLSGFMILRVFTGQDLVEMELKIKEQAGERVELFLSYNLGSFQEFMKGLKKINSKVEKKDFGDKVFKYDFSSENKVELCFYLNKSEWTQFYKFLENCQKEIIEQAQEYKNLTEKEGNK